MKRFGPFIVFLLAGLVSGFFTFQALMMAVWGAPTHPIQYISFFSSLALVIAAFIYLYSERVGRIAAAIAVVGVGVLYIPASISLVPASNHLISPLQYLTILGYFILLVFAFFYPKRWRISLGVLILALGLSIGFAGHTFYKRYKDGEYARPIIVYYKWVEGKDGLVEVNNNPGTFWLPEGLKQEMMAQGIKGELHWTGGIGGFSRAHKVIVICKSRIPAPKELYYPKIGTIVYLFDGQSWRSFSESSGTYPAYATLREDGMIYREIVGGTQGTLAFFWK